MNPDSTPERFFASFSTLRRARQRVLESE